MFEKAFRELHTPYRGGPVSGDYLGPLGEALPESLGSFLRACATAPGALLNIATNTIQHRAYPKP